MKAWRSTWGRPGPHATAPVPQPRLSPLPPLPGRPQWERRLSRFSSCRASRASWATLSSTVMGPPGPGSAAERIRGGSPALSSRTPSPPPQDRWPQSTCCHHDEPSTVGATYTLLQPQHHGRATSDSGSPIAHPLQSTLPCPFAAARQDSASRGRCHTVPQSLSCQALAQDRTPS